MSGGTYDVAQICENGHVITDKLRTSPERAQKFCEDCGAATISACRNCNADIPGHHREPYVLTFGYGRPSFCRNCGLAYPWTQAALDDFKSLAELAEGLTPEQQKQLGAAIDDIVVDTPKTNGAIARIKLLAPKVAGEVWQAMRQIIVEVGTEAAKKQLGV